MGAGKKILITIGIIAAVLVIAAAIAYFVITGSPTVSAQVHVESGSVLVNGGQITSDVKLKEGDMIETGADGKATVILYESVLISLDAGTKVTINELVKEHPQVTQEGGETWSKVTKLSGVQEYSVTSGNSVASVRGTAFAITDNKIVTGEGNVEYTVDGKSYTVGLNRVVEKIGEKINEREANTEERAKIKAQTERSIEMLKVLREKELQKHPNVVSMIEGQLSQGGEMGLRAQLEAFDSNNEDIDEIVRNSPIRMESVNKVAEITKKIRELKLGLGQVSGTAGLINQTLSSAK